MREREGEGIKEGGRGRGEVDGTKVYQAMSRKICWLINDNHVAWSPSGFFPLRWRCFGWTQSRKKVGHLQTWIPHPPASEWQREVREARRR